MTLIFIRHRYVLTAGHCVDFCSMKIRPGCRRTDPFPQISIKVSLGEHNHGGKIKPVPLQHYHVTRVTIHPNFTNELHTRPDGYIEVTESWWICVSDRFFSGPAPL